MTDYVKIEGLHRRLVDERRRHVEGAAEYDVLPPAGRMAYIASVDATIMAVEAVLQERTGLAETAAAVPAPEAFARKVAA